MANKKNKKDRDFREYKVPKRKQPVFKFFSKLLFSPLYKSKFESAIENLPDKAIIVSNHSAKRGPISIAVSYPKFAVTWGHSDMLGTYKQRFLYLRNVFYMQKLHKNKFVATLKALYEAVFSVFIYKGIKVIGTYTDMRLLTTVRNSMDVLNDNASVIIYPEDSSEGYFDEVSSAFPGFVILSQLYFKKYGEDVPVIPAYVSLKSKRFILGEPKYLNGRDYEGLTKEEIAESIKDEINALYKTYIVTGNEIKPTVKDAPVRKISDPETCKTNK